MKIQKIIIKNFRSIKSAEIDVDNFNIFVGQNNCGKTNLFEAIEFFYSGLKKSAGDIKNLKFGRDDNLDMSVEIKFSHAQDGMNKMINEKNQTVIRNLLDGSDTVSFRRVNSEKIRKAIIDGKEIKPGTGFDNALNDFLPRFEYINTKQYYDSVAKYAKGTPIGIMLSGVLTLILEEDTRYKEFQNKFRDLFENSDSAVKTTFDEIGSRVKFFLEKQFPDCNNVKFEVTIPIFDDLLKNFDTSIDDGIETYAEEKGDGMQRALMLAIIQVFAEFRKKNEDINKSFLFFIDEAELHLHPTAQRKLKNILFDLSSGMDQVFINTHSSVFVAEDKTNQKIFKIEKYNRESDINEINALEKPYIIYELLGGSPADLLLPRNFLIVEGQSEVDLLTSVIRRFYSDKIHIQIIPAKGDIDQATRTLDSINITFNTLDKETESSINDIDKVYSTLYHSGIFKDKAVLLLDKPSEKREDGVKQFMKTYNLENNKQLFILPCTDIEQYYPSQPCDTYTNWKHTEENAKKMASKKKRKLAKHVGKNITQEQFEKDLEICYSALRQTWALAY